MLKILGITDSKMIIGQLYTQPFILMNFYVYVLLYISAFFISELFYSSILIIAVP